MHSAAGNYGKQFAKVYDDIFPQLTSESPEINSILSWFPVAPARVLELGIGTGRFALPLKERLQRMGIGVEFHGIDLSGEMLEILHARDKPPYIGIEQGSVVDGRYPSELDLIVCVCGTLSAIADDTSRRKIFSHAFRALRPGGSLLVENFHADFVRSLHGQSDGPVPLAVPYPGDRRMLVSFSTLDDNVWQVEHCWITGGQAVFLSEETYLCDANEVDSYAQLAGLQKIAQYGSMTGVPLDSSSSMYVAIYRKPARA